MTLNDPYAKFSILLFLVIVYLYPITALAQDKQNTFHNPDSLLRAAREMIAGIRFCALITLDKEGHPQSRTMDPFLPDSNMVVWFGTNRSSRKVQEIKNNPIATLYYQAENGAGYVVLKGNAHWVDDPQLKLKYWKSDWEAFYPESRENYTLIKFVPFHLEIVDYKHNLVGDTVTWEAPNLELR